MKKIVAAAMMAILATGSTRASIDMGGIANIALKDVVADARASLAQSEKVPSGEPVAILPIAEDAGLQIVELLKGAIAEAGITCVEGKEDPMWDAILKEIEWDERKADMLDPATLDKFGRLKSAKYLLYGSIRRLAASERYVLLELELHCSCIATKEHVWGGSFVRRHFVPGADPKGAVEIPSAVRLALVEGVKAKVSASLAKSGRLGAVKRVAFLPIAGDVDGYAEGLFRDVLSTSSITPVNLDVSTRAEARFALREGGGKADAIAYGALRDLEAKLVETKAAGDKIYTALMELQLWIEKGSSREILWSDTVQFTKEFSAGPRGWWDKLCLFFPWLGNPVMVGATAIGIVLVLIFLIFVFPRMVRVR